jgi:hypothetical protein
MPDLYCLGRRLRGMGCGERVGNDTKAVGRSPLYPELGVVWQHYESSERLTEFLGT